MTTDEIRKTFIDFFVERDHKRLPSSSLIPAEHDPSALFTVAGMHPLKPYFQGVERPPHPRVTSCQKTFRTADIEIIGTTTRHLTFFEMLGNFSFGDYFKREAVRFAWELSLEGFGFAPEDVWITVFAGDAELGLGLDEEAVQAWLEVGVPRERIVECPRSENFWQAGPTGPCGPCSELYLDRGLDFGKPDDLPGGDNERFLEYWNLVFMQLDQNPVNVLTPLPAKNIDTGLGLNRLAAILQDKTTVFETDQFAPLIALGEELSGRSYGHDFPTDKALRVLADHGRAITFLIADGVVPSNEDRGYVLRRIMRRAILQGRHALGLDPGFMSSYAERVTELMGSAYPELHEQREIVLKWLESEEQSFGRTLEQGTKLLDDVIARARDAGEEGIAAQDAFLLHDTYGFPIDLTLEIVAEHDLGVDEEGFEALMGEQRTRSRASADGDGTAGALRERAVAFSGAAGFATDFVGYETTDRETTVGAVESDNGRVLVKLVESPFYATGGGQVADSGYVECADGDCRARRAGRAAARRRSGCRGHARARHARARRARARARRPARAPRDRVQSHGNAPSARGPATAARVARSPGGVVRRSRQAALRLHARELAERRSGGRARATGQRMDPRESAGARDHDHADRSQAARRDGAVRREVRRRRADGRGRRRLVLARALRGHARAPHLRDRAVQDPLGDLERRQRSPDRGRHGSRGG